MRIKTSWVLLSVVLVGAGCADSRGPDENGADGGGAGGGNGDPVRVIEECAGGESVLDAWLAPELHALANVCHTPEGGSFAAHVRNAGSFALVHLQSEVNGPHTVITLDRYVVSLATSALKHDGETCTLSLDARTPTARVELASELRLSPAGELAYFRVRETEYMPDSSYLDSKAFVVARDCTVVEHARPDYFGYEGSVLLISEDPDALITQGVLRDGGSGLLRGPDVIATGGSGDMQRVDDTRVLAVTGSGHGAVWLSLYDQRALETGPFPVAGMDLEGEEWPWRFEALDGRGIVGRAVFELTEDHYLYAVPGITGDRAATEHSTVFASVRFSQVLPVTGSKRVLLRHERGLLVVE